MFIKKIAEGFQKCISSVWMNVFDEKMFLEEFSTGLGFSDFDQNFWNSWRKDFECCQNYLLRVQDINLRREEYFKGKERQLDIL